MPKNSANNTVDAKVLGDLLEKLLGRPVLRRGVVPVSGENSPGRAWAHPLEFPAGGGLFIIIRGEVNGFVGTVTEAGWGHPELISALSDGDSFYLCPIKKAFDRHLTYDPVAVAEIYYLEWSELNGFLPGAGDAAGVIGELLLAAQARLAEGLAVAAAHLPDQEIGSPPELIVPESGSIRRENDFPGVSPVSLSPGKTWSDENAVGVFIARGQVRVGIGPENKFFCVREAGLQATGGKLILQAESESVLYPIIRPKPAA